ncbi:hypothetical protein TRFO_09508 [Tritrichomonas foetus]|uniref:KANL2-like probable zinc-finger domain-containing protein n=1 Tax=Tritrichomonas foetus TaxID=1144522 RepID=A0A1J4JIA4_9EUKA|nr:hypothetical protein TRFO_09508 [Tritrichomonas foetus]|eukprot:OHS97253.1 hypothetical protein TRFO_09508 [Tritrichomonas foetus]
MSSALHALLQANGIDPNIFDPPETYEVSPSVVDSDELFSSFDTNQHNLIQNRDDDNSPLTNDDEPNDSITSPENYVQLRQLYLKTIRDENKINGFEEGRRRIENIAREGSLKDLETLFKQKHIWQSQINALSGSRIICANESCVFEAVPGSKFCVNHIHQDPNQNFFVQCQKCGRNHSKMSICHFCGS